METQIQQAPQPDASFTQPSVIVSGRNNAGKIILVVILLVLLICSLVINYLQYQNISFLGLSNRSPRLPINPENSYVEDYSITYYIKTKITNITKTPDGLDLSTSINDRETPKKFHVTPETVVSVSADGIKDKAKPSDMNQLKVGQAIQLWMYQNSRTANWVTFKIVFTPTK